ncbi:MAG: cytochrome c maturation protein CcmE [Chloroflexi bacterium]|nr:cytochrome c maturation protein CcmE [Chloroflexota bacterium]
MVAHARSQQRSTFWKRRRFLIVGALVVLALAYMMYMAFESAATYWLTVGELMAQGDAVYDQWVRVGGKVDQNIQWDGAKLKMEFTITDDKSGKSLPVVYQGVVPDAFQPGADVVLEGRYTGGVFQAKNLMAKCPSKYLPIPG